MKINPGDVLSFEDENGERITLHVVARGIIVKAEHPWTKLVVNRDNDYTVFATVKRR